MQVMRTYIVRDTNGNLQIMYEAGPDQFGPGPFYYMTTNGHYGRAETYMEEVDKDTAREMIKKGPR